MFSIYENFKITINRITKTSASEKLIGKEKKFERQDEVNVKEKKNIVISSSRPIYKFIYSNSKYKSKTTFY